MEEARRLGVSYGRTRTGTTPGNGSLFPRIVPRTRHTERVRTSIRNRVREVRDTIVNVHEQYIDPNQPSTSSGFDSIGDNSRSRSPNNNFHMYENNASSAWLNTKSRTRIVKKKTKKRRTNSKRNGDTLIREVRITEFNDDGEEEEIVTYVKVASPTSRKKHKKRTKRTRKVYR